MQAVREGLGIVIYARDAFPATLEGSAFVPLAPTLALPFDLAFRDGDRSPALRAVLDVSKELGRD